MTGIVIDCSITMAWCFDDEADAYSLAVLDLLSHHSAKVPSHWPLEVANVLAINERRGRTTPEQSDVFLRELAELPIHVSTDTGERVFGEVLRLARAYRLTIYDAAYLELAQRESLTLCTLDHELVVAAPLAGVDLFLPTTASH